MKVLFVTSEVAPIKKFGGLGDFSASLPKALSALGIDIDIIVPFYTDIKEEKLKIYKSIELYVSFDNETHNAAVYKTKLPDSDIDVLLVKMDREFTGDFLTDVEFFAFFDKCVVEYIKTQFNTYSLVHCNDWHTGFVTHLLEDEVGSTRPKTLLTIHNLAYQGISTPRILQEVGFSPGQHQLIDWDANDGDINMLYQAVTSSDYFNTVSPSYAKELLTYEFAKGFAELVEIRADRFSGILNGIDYTTLPRNYDISNWKEKKSSEKIKLQRTLKLKEDGAPIFAFISRIDPGQKGIDILYEVIPEIVKNGGRFILLGSGAKEWEEKLVQLQNSEELKNSISITIGFDADLATEIYAGSDFFLIPSKYEPCGLTQMISMWYGTLPIARNTGGLKDSIKNDINGILFDEYSADALKNAIQRAFDLYKNGAKMGTAVETAMKEDFGWGKSAIKYKELYEKMLD